MLRVGGRSRSVQKERTKRTLTFPERSQAPTTDSRGCPQLQWAQTLVWKHQKEKELNSLGSVSMVSHFQNKAAAGGGHVQPSRKPAKPPKAHSTPLTPRGQLHVPLSLQPQHRGRGTDESVRPGGHRRHVSFPAVVQELFTQARQRTWFPPEPVGSCVSDPAEARGQATRSFPVAWGKSLHPRLLFPRTRGYFTSRHPTLTSEVLLFHCL